MMTSIGEITVGTLVKRVKRDMSPCMTKGKVYEVVRVEQVTQSFGHVEVINDQGKEWTIDLDLYKIVGHIDDDDGIDNFIIEELDQLLDFCLKYNDLESYIVNKA